MNRVTHWHVFIGAPGAGNVDEDTAHLTRAEANAYATQQARLFRELGCRVTGSASVKRYIALDERGEETEILIRQCRDPRCFSDSTLW